MSKVVSLLRRPNEEIISLLREGEHASVGSDKLRNLLKLLPSTDESDMLRNFTGDAAKLGNAEKFLVQLMKLPQSVYHLPRGRVLPMYLAGVMS